jgi:hypothetical protein
MSMRMLAKDDFPRDRGGRGAGTTGPPPLPGQLLHSEQMHPERRDQALLLEAQAREALLTRVISRSLWDTRPQPFF